MTDVRNFQKLLDSLLEMTGLGFEILDGDGTVLSCSAAAEGKPDSEHLQEMTRRVIDSSSFQHMRTPGPKFLFGTPIRKGNGVMGVLLAYGAKPGSGMGPREGEPKPEDIERLLNHLLGGMADLIGQHAANQQEIDDITEQLSQSFEELHLFSRIATQIKTLRFSNTMLRSLIEEIMDGMGADLAFARFLQHAEQDVHVRGESIAHEIPDPEGLADKLLRSIPLETRDPEHNYFVLNNSDTSPTFRPLMPEPFRFLGVRIEHESEFYGWLGLLSLNMREIFRQNELRLLTSMAEQVAAVIANTDLYRDLERFIVNMVKSLVHAIEAKDVYTRGHSERVSEYSMRIAEVLSLDKKDRDNLQWASILHDIGKIAISEQVLNKPGRLTDREYHHIQDHSRHGFNILSPLEQLSESLPAILHHHERFDGGGYPDGLKGEEIPLLARIIAVADTYDAMTSDRAYRPAKLQEEALEILEEVAGTQLDPRLAELFVEMIRQELDEDLGHQRMRLAG
jgi:HD-GYP domain-containing protein (c-di-GMP phosphodiesterase class II)